MKRIAIVGILILLALLFAMATGAGLYYRALYILFLALAGSYAWTRLNLSWLEVQVQRNIRRTQVGDVIEERLSVRNKSPLPKAWLEVQDLSTMPGYRAGQVITLPGRTSRAWKATITATRRGVYTLGPVRVASGDPLGFFNGSRRFLDSQEIIVYPLTVSLPFLRLPTPDMLGEGSLRLRTPQVTPHASTIREYKSGDSLNRIHWPTTARTERLMVKEFDQGVGGGVWLLLDMQKSVQAGSEAETTDEYGVTLAASVAKKHLEMGLPVGFLGYGEQRYFLPLQRGAGHLQQLMDQLARIKAEGMFPLHEVLLKEGDLFTRYTTLIVITPSLDPTWVSPLEILAGRRVKVVAMHLDAVSFGSRGSTTWTSEALQRAGILTYVIGKDDNLSQAVSLSKALSVHAQGPRRREVVG